MLKSKEMFWKCEIEIAHLIERKWNKGFCLISQLKIKSSVAQFLSWIQSHLFIDLTATRNFISRANKKIPCMPFMLQGAHTITIWVIFFFFFFLGACRGVWSQFWTSACCSFNWVTTDSKAHKSNFIMLSFGTSAQRGNINRQLSEKWSLTIWHRHSNSLCHPRKAALACREYCLWAQIQEMNKGSWTFFCFSNAEDIKRYNCLFCCEGSGEPLESNIDVIKDQTVFL